MCSNWWQGKDMGPCFDMFSFTLIWSENIIHILLCDYCLNHFQEKFDVKEDQKDYMMSLALEKYRSYRNKMKAMYCNSWAEDEERLRHKPPILASDAY